MTAHRAYPESDAGPFPRPPATFEDREGRTIAIGPLDDLDGLIEMYTRFDPAMRAQGIPPADPERIPGWVGSVVKEGVHLVAREGDETVGHAMVVPDDEGAHELAIFVVQSHQNAGIGRAVLEHLLGAAEDVGIDRIWLTVERWNAPALALYRDVGFETVQAERFDLEMALSIA